MYFLCGLPTETEADVRGMVDLALRIREEVLLPAAGASGRMGRLSMSVNPFVPKPWTPFQWQPLAPKKELESKRAMLERALRPKGVEVDFFSPRQARLQTLLSRGDRRVADLLEIAHRTTGGDLNKALAEWPHDPDFFVFRELGVDEVLPWDFIDQGIEKQYLLREQARGLRGQVTKKCAFETCRACGLACADGPGQAPPGV